MRKANGSLTGDIYWQADTADAAGQLTQITHGNLVITSQAYDVNMGRIASIQASSGITPIQNQSFVFDTIGNLQTRTDVIADTVESFTYDDLNRLPQASLSYAGGTPTVKTVSYNAIGNITAKSDVGSYSYPASGAASVRPHAVSSITGTVNGSVNPSFAYDANGNMLSGAGRTLTWTAFNMPVTIAQGANTLSFAYDPERQRIKQVEPSGTTTYVNDTAAGLKVERFVGASNTTWRNYVYAANYVSAAGVIVWQGRQIAARSARGAVENGKLIAEGSLVICGCKPVLPLSGDEPCAPMRRPNEGRPSCRVTIVHFNARIAAFSWPRWRLSSSPTPAPSKRVGSRNARSRSSSAWRRAAPWTARRAWRKIRSKRPS